MDFPYFKVMNAIMGGRAIETSVHLLDSAASSSPATVKAESDEEGTTEAVRQHITPTPAVSRQPPIPAPVSSSQTTTTVPAVSSQPPTPAPVASNQTTTPIPAVSSQPPTPAPAASSQATTPAPAASSQPPMPAPSVSSCPSTPSLPDDDTPVAKKKQRRVQCAEKAATSLVQDVLAVQVKIQERREEMEKELAAKEEERSVLMKESRDSWIR